MFVQFGPLVRINKVARIGLGKTWCACGQDVLQAISQLNFDLLVAQILQSTGADESVLVR